MSDEVKIGMVVTGDPTPADVMTASLKRMEVEGKQLQETLDKTAKDLDKTGDAGKKAASGGVQAQTGFAAASAAASAASGNIQGVAAALGSIAPKLQALQTALPVIGMLLAAFVAWKKAIEAIQDAQAAQAAGLREITSGNISAGIDRVSDAYARLTEEIDKAAQAQQDVLDGERKLAEAKRDSELAQIELDKQKALAAESDPLKRQAIEADAAARKEQVSSAFGQGEEARTAAALTGRRDAARNQAQAAAIQEDVLTRKLAGALQQQGNVQALQREDMEGLWMPWNASRKTGKKYEPEIAELGEKIKEVRGQLADVRKERLDAEAEAGRAEADIAANQVSAGARATERQAAAVAAGAGVAGAQKNIVKRDADSEAQTRKLQQTEEALAAKEDEARALQDKLDGLARSARQETGEAREASAALAGAEAANARRARPDRERNLAPYRQTATREEAEAREANAAFAGAKGEIGKMLQALVADIKRLESEVKAQRSRSARAGVDVEAGA